MPRLTPYQREECVRRYLAGESSTHIGVELGVSHVAVCGLIRRRGYSVRTQQEAQTKHTASHDYFSAIDSEEKAYWLGFLLADCGISGHQVTLRLAAKDESHLLRFRAALKSSHKITRIPAKLSAEAVQFSIKSPRMVSDLAALGVTANKSFTAIPPTIDHAMQRHLWRGIIDGDGNITLGRAYWKENRNSATIRLYGSEPTCRAFASWVGIGTTSPHKSIWLHCITGRQTCKHVAGILYSDATVALPRKMTLALELIGHTS